MTESQKEFLRSRQARGQMEENEISGNTQNVSNVSNFQPLVDKVGVPLAWFAAGYIVCMLMESRKGKSSNVNG